MGEMADMLIEMGMLLDEVGILDVEPRQTGERKMAKHLVDFSRADITRVDWNNTYKIHAIETVQDYLDTGEYDHCNNVFYEGSLDDVIDRCQGYLGKPNQTSEGFVIFKAVAVVRLPRRETEVIRFDAIDGEKS